MGLVPCQCPRAARDLGRHPCSVLDSRRADLKVTEQHLPAAPRERSWAAWPRRLASLPPLPSIHRATDPPLVHSDVLKQNQTREMQVKRTLSWPLPHSLQKVPVSLLGLLGRRTRRWAVHVLVGHGF